MARAVHIEIPVGLGLDQFPLFSLQQAQLNEAPCDHTHRRIVGLIPGVTGAHFGNRGALRLEYQVVYRPLFWRKLAANREGSCDIGGVSLILAAGVNQDQVTGLHPRRVFCVMQHASIYARSYNGVVGRKPRTML